ILQEKNNPKHPEKPAKFNLSEIQSASETVNSDPILILNQLKKYRQKIIEIMGTYSDSEKSWSIKPIEIDDFKTEKELKSEVIKMIRASYANPLDEKKLSDVYLLLTENEMTEKYQNLPLITVINNLSLLQNRILTART